MAERHQSSVRNGKADQWRFLAEQQEIQPGPESRWHGADDARRRQIRQDRNLAGFQDRLLLEVGNTDRALLQRPAEREAIRRRRRHRESRRPLDEGVAAASSPARKAGSSGEGARSPLPFASWLGWGGLIPSAAEPTDWNDQRSSRSAP